MLLLSPVESVREAQLRLLKSRLSSEAALKINALSSALRDLNELIKIPLVELALPSLRQMSLPEYAAFRENTASLIATDQQVDLFEFALQKMLRRNLEPKFKPEPEPETRHSTLAELGVAGSTVLSALAHAGQDTIKAAQAAFQRGVKHIEQIEAPFNFVALADCTLKSVDEGLDALAQSTTSLKKQFLRACSETIAADEQSPQRPRRLLRAGACVRLRVLGRLERQRQLADDDAASQKQRPECRPWCSATTVKIHIGTIHLAGVRRRRDHKDVPAVSDVPRP